MRGGHVQQTICLHITSEDLVELLAKCKEKERTSLWGDDLEFGKWFIDKATTVTFTVDQTRAQNKGLLGREEGVK